ncbi:MBL fold metallo-hydrolase RNA specificity domain-containing protein [Streptomyces sp. NPDC093801]|uniref:MBL fold metallo-hydrolase RNA specificity domain-containing protein n=1 Tax=Streptomyces sp. NPDC093801 TaxID=3155203 RepID=UPI00344D4806
MGRSVPAEGTGRVSWTHHGGCRADQIVGRLRGAPPPHTTYLVHGEETASATLRARVDHELGWTAVVPGPGEAVLVR